MTTPPTPPPHFDQATNATRRTRLAGERTELAWWRTGLAALAVGLAVGRVVPGLEDKDTRWPFVAVGICFAIYGVAVIAYGTFRNRQVQRELDSGRFPERPTLAHGALAIAGIALGLLTAILIAFG